jgi:hypothetical protein
VIIRRKAYYYDKDPILPRIDLILSRVQVTFALAIGFIAHVYSS